LENKRKFGSSKIKAFPKFDPRLNHKLTILEANRLQNDLGAFNGVFEGYSIVIHEFDKKIGPYQISTFPQKLNTFQSFYQAHQAMSYLTQKQGPSLKSPTCLKTKPLQQKNSLRNDRTLPVPP
jgi:hypothetical protein